jgi:hypothetical protein
MRPRRSRENSKRSYLNHFKRVFVGLRFFLPFSGSLPVDSSHRSGPSRIEPGKCLPMLATLLLLALLIGFPVGADARSVVTPWNGGGLDGAVGRPGYRNFQELVYGGSSQADVVRVMGVPPDEVVHAGQMFPVIENYYYYDEDKSGAATVFVFENSLLVGLQMKTAANQFVDMTYFLANNGDRTLNQPMLGGYMQYYPWFPIPSW